jgi:hypothetical protein
MVVVGDAEKEHSVCLYIARKVLSCGTYVA